MSATGLDVFDKTLQTTHIWLDELMAEIGFDRQAAWHVLGAVLRAVRDRIPLELAVHLGSQLPLLVRGLYYDQWHASGRMDKNPRSLDAFLEPIREQLAQIRPIDASNVTQAVFRILSRHANPGQIEKVKHALPGEVQAIWIEVTPDTRVRWSGPSHGVTMPRRAAGAPEGGLPVRVGREGIVALALAAAGLVAGVMILLRIKQLQPD